MRLVELKPKWMRLNGEAVGIIFLCPRCVAKGCANHRLTWLTVTFIALQNRQMRELIEAAIAGYPSDFAETNTHEHDVVGCKPIAWKRDCKVLETISISPSLDAGASGHWHGHIRNGRIVGGI